MLFALRQERVVPIAVELVALETQPRQFVIADLGTGGVVPGIEFGANSQPGSSRGVGWKIKSLTPKAIVYKYIV